MKTKIALTTILLYVIGCSSTVKPPKWYVSPPEYKKGIRYTSGTATADDLQTAFDMARLAAETDLGKELKSQLNGSMDRERNVLKGKTTLDRFRATVESVISADISGATIEKREYKSKGKNNNHTKKTKYYHNGHPSSSQFSYHAVGPRNICRQFYANFSTFYSEFQPISILLFCIF